MQPSCTGGFRDSYPRASGEVVQVEFEISGCAGWGDLSFGKSKIRRYATTRPSMA